MYGIYTSVDMNDPSLFQDHKQAFKVGYEYIHIVDMSDPSLNKLSNYGEN